MNNQDNIEDENEGREVSLISSGISIIVPQRKMDMTALHNWVESITSDMPTLNEENNAVAHMKEVVAAFVERYEDNIINSLEGEYVFVNSDVLTKLTLGALKFDKLIEVSPNVHFLVNMIGFCPVIKLFNRKEYETVKHKVNKDNPFLGKIKIITFDELFYQP